eukprot:10090586-Heterocapsa_arctica.AAC.1
MGQIALALRHRSAPASAQIVRASSKVCVCVCVRESALITTIRPGSQPVSQQASQPARRPGGQAARWVRQSAM